MPAAKLEALLTLGALFMLLTFCDTVDNQLPSDPDNIELVLVNDSHRDAQILGPGEQPDPSLVLAPSRSREMVIEDVKKDDVFRFRALVFEESIGGNWLEVANQACVYDGQLHQGRMVSYRGGIALICENW